MTTAKYMEEEHVIKKGVEALMRELGPVETMRFMSIPRKKRLESVKRHRQWQRLLNKEEFFAEVFGE